MTKNYLNNHSKIRKTLSNDKIINKECNSDRNFFKNNFQMKIEEKNNSNIMKTNSIEIFVLKDHCYKDFGFYIAENKILNCLYISKIRENGPADGIMELKPLKKLLKVIFFSLNYFLN
jgi:hypothetical protein